MCGGGCCNPLGTCLGEIAYTMERMAACIAAVAIVSCIIFTILLMLGAGIGLGYNYCFVETRINATMAAARKPKRYLLTPPRTTSTGRPALYRKRRSKDLITALPERLQLDQIFTGQVSNEDWKRPMTSQIYLEVEIRPTMMIPLQYSGLKSLIDKLQKKNRNFRIELLAERLIQK